MFARRPLSTAGQLRLVSRTFKNFGHVRERVSGITTIWHTLLTCLFIGAGIEWKRMYGIVTGEDDWKVPRDATDQTADDNSKIENRRPS